MTELENSTEDVARSALSPSFLHELRTPINHIIGFSEMLTEQAEEEGQSGFLPDLQEIHHAARQLLLMLSEGAPLPHEAAEGSTPIADDTASATAKTEAKILKQAPGSSHALILAVDDIKANRDVLSRRLIRQGYDVAMAENGRQALEMLRAQNFDLVLLDIMMPEMDGYQVLQEIKADEALRHIPVIMISALHEMDSVVRCIQLGAEDYLCKPFDQTLLKARIGACLETKRGHDREVRLFDQLQQNYKLLQELEKQRDDLTHMIVHDLRTPLTSVIAGMQTLDMAGDLNDLQRELITIASKGGETLLGMINDLLDVEKMESGTMQLEYSALDAETLIAGAMAQVASLAEFRNVSVIKQTAHELPTFQGDAGKLTRTLVNLIGNAIKFTPTGGSITIEAHISEDENSVVFSVSDTGEGIPEESFARIFEKFGQVENRKAGRIMSTGLGLAFCKLAVEAHGGHIGVESILGEGSTFCYAIPFNIKTA